MNQFEVELKFQVDSFDQVERELAERGASVVSSGEQRDQYYQHPCRDFAETDEALRIRRTDADARVTWKGPKLDAETRTRREIELPLVAQSDQQWDQLLQSLGFAPTGEVCKQRREFELLIESRSIRIALDEVERVGRFVELETIAAQESLDLCRELVKRLAAELGLRDSIRTSYLRFVLDADSDG